jgi:hypothetical protein
MSDGSLLGNDTVVVRTRGLTRADGMIQIVILTSFPVAVLFIIFLSGPRPPVDVLPRLWGIVGLLSGLDLLMMEIVSVRQVRIGASGVSFRFLLHSEHRAWQDLGPSKLIPDHGVWGVTSSSRIGRAALPRGYRLTLTQAQAMLDHPSCPAWDIPPAVRHGLGLAPANLRSSRE